MKSYGPIVERTDKNNKTIVIDNFIGPKRFKIYQQSIFNELKDSNLEETWYSINEDHKYKHLCFKLLELAAKYYDLSSCIGYEFWTQNNSRPNGWHYDKDEGLMKVVEKYSFPICSMVYYLRVQDLVGGKLYLDDDIIITPKSDRVVIFPPGTNHCVEEFNGSRTSILVNPWDKPLYTDTESL